MDAPESSKAQPRLKRIRGFVCEICYDDSEREKETIALGCGHRYCRDCYASYLESKIRWVSASLQVDRCALGSTD